ncbi:hypothetical protein PJP10_32595, partial [Mycobacterium kansasii]
SMGGCREDLGLSQYAYLLSGWKSHYLLFGWLHHFGFLVKSALANMPLYPCPCINALQALFTH